MVSHLEVAWKSVENVSTDWPSVASVLGGHNSSLWEVFFSEAWNLGMSVGVVGWYHPYCRLFMPILTSCEWVPIQGRLNDRALTAWSVERAMTNTLVEDLVDRGPNIILRIIQREATLKY